MRRHRPVGWLGLGIAAILGAGVVGGVVARSGRPTTVEIRVHFSSYEPGRVTVPAGVPVTFILVNTDPIDHEWIVGDEEVHRRHRTGTEAVHGARPTEVTLPALSERRTTITFDRPGALTFICHLPGHEAYGMVGTLVVAGG
jgi:uncharacterized cupredoxin-like copper-binding protein